MNATAFEFIEKDATVLQLKLLILFCPSCIQEVVSFYMMDGHLGCLTYYANKDCDPSVERHPNWDRFEQFYSFQLTGLDPCSLNELEKKNAWERKRILCLLNCNLLYQVFFLGFFLKLVQVFSFQQDQLGLGWPSQLGKNPRILFSLYTQV